MKLTVYHDGQYWVGVVEEIEVGKLKAARHIFGSEPKDAEVLDFVKRNLLTLTSNLSQAVNVKDPSERRLNPKRLARQVAREMQKTGVSTYAQQALKLEYEHRKRERQVLSRQQREELKERKRAIAREKAKAKHRGR
jgi:hypothetical protein